MHCGQHAPSPIEQEHPSHPNGHEQMSQIISILSLFGGLLPRVIGLIVSMALLCTGAVAQDSPRSDKPQTIVFVCLHGSVKSQVAAAHFNCIAKERGLPLVAISRGIAVDPSIPASIRQGLAADGLIPPDDVPVPLASADTTGAIEVFAFDEVPNDRKGSREVTYWSDVPPATKDYVVARDAIVRQNRGSYDIAGEEVSGQASARSSASSAPMPDTHDHDRGTSDCSVARSAPSVLRSAITRLGRIFARMQSRNTERRERLAMGELNDHLLADIGLHRQSAERPTEREVRILMLRLPHC